MAVDREAALKRAEKCLRQGRLGGAIEEYVRLIAEQPRDWASVNALGDLYVRAGQPARAVEQYVRLADFLFDEGFLPKAQAVYKKALKVLPTHDHTLLRLAEIATRQGVFVDARQFLRQLAAERHAKGDAQGAAECTVRLGLLDDADAQARIEAAEAAQHLQDVELAARLLANPKLVIALAAQEMRTGREAEALQRLTRLVVKTPEHVPEIMALALAEAEDGHGERAFACVDMLVDAALLEGEPARGVELLRTFVSRAPLIPALTKLVGVCVDAGLELEMREAQTMLAEAYRRAGREEEARAVTEDMSADADGLVDEAFFQDLPLVPHGEPAAGDVPPIRPWTATPVVPPPDAEPPSSSSSAAATYLSQNPLPDTDDEPIVIEGFEVDLSETLQVLEATPVLPPAAGPAPPLEAVFEQFRADAARDQIDGDADEQFRVGMQLLADGRVQEALPVLQSAARTPALRFVAGAQLGRTLVTAGEVAQGIEWFERAAEAPAPTSEEAADLLYDLAAALESTGESARALAVLLELQADVSGHRDVAAWIERLSRAQTGSEA